jgi:class 3 adenylate cyclase
VFADIVAFTPLSGALKPEELAALMARFYDVKVLRHVAVDGLTVLDLGELELKGIPAPVRCHCIAAQEAEPRAAS